MSSLREACVAIAAATTLCALPARADTDCAFLEWGTRQLLVADCETDATIEVPEGKTLDGRGHTIVAVDPPGGRFLGAVVRNAGSVAHVRRLSIETRMLTNACGAEGPPDTRLRGIYFEGASGSIVDNRVSGLQRTESGCQEGQGIEIRHSSEGAAQERGDVRVMGNHIEGYQKTGILVLGHVNASVLLNEVTGLGPTPRLAQNGIQFGDGATGSIKLNRVRDTLYASEGAASSGILLYEAGPGVDVSLNRVEDADVGVAIASTSDARIRGNVLEGLTFDGITLEGRAGATQNNLVAGNHVSGGMVGIDLLGPGATGNTVRRNRIEHTTSAGVQLVLEADANQIRANALRLNEDFGIWIGSDGNEIVDNRIFQAGGTPLEDAGNGNLVEGNVIYDAIELAPLN